MMWLSQPLCSCCRLGGVMSAFALAKSLRDFVVPFAIGELALFAIQVLSGSLSGWHCPQEG